MEINRKKILSEEKLQQMLFAIGIDLNETSSEQVEQILIEGLEILKEKEERDREEKERKDREERERKEKERKERAERIRKEQDREERERKEKKAKAEREIKERAERERAKKIEEVRAIAGEQIREWREKNLPKDGTEYPINDLQIYKIIQEEQRGKKLEEKVTYAEDSRFGILYIKDIATVDEEEKYLYEEESKAGIMWNKIKETVRRITKTNKKLLTDGSNSKKSDEVKRDKEDYYSSKDTKTMIDELKVRDENGDYLGGVIHTKEENTIMVAENHEK